MDALRKAEEAKRNAAAKTGEAPASNNVASEQPTPPAELSLDWVPISSGTEAPRFEIDDAITATASANPAASEPFAAPTPPMSEADADTPSLAPSPTPKTERKEPTARPSARPTPPQAKPEVKAAIQNVFASKQAKHNNTFAWTVGVSTLLAVIAIGIYFWWQLQPHGGITPTPLALQAMPPMSPPPQALPPLPSAPPVSLPAAPAATTASLPASPSMFQDKASIAPAKPIAVPRRDSPVRFSSSTKPRINPYVEEGYAALQAGNLSLARQAYEKVLAAEPQNTDALYGLAAIALQNGQPQSAEDYYLRALEIDPRDPVAHAGLVGLRGQSAGANAESRLKSLIAEQPSVSALHFALGNLYARQERWRDAQQAYFQAYRNDASNPDIVFNLAISLDQIHQSKPAAQYYAEAIRLAETQAHGFDATDAKRRLRQLQP